MSVHTKNFDFAAELEKTVVHSLTTSFGLDFLLFKDKQGGDVDTIHNVRKGIYATDNERLNYDNREAYDSHAYHSHKNYINKGRIDKSLQQQGELHDSYRNQTMAINENRQLDHTISASEIHHDAGRVLAGLSGTELANQDSNLNSTHWYVNNLKRDHSTEKFLNEIAPSKLNTLKQQIEKDKALLKQLPENTPQQRDKKRQIEAKLKADTDKAEALNSVLENKSSMLAADKKARDSYNQQINYTYYTSSKFLKNTAVNAGLSGLKLGTRQAIGLVLAEVWFELKESFPKILANNRSNFEIGTFIRDIKETVLNIFERVKVRFKEILSVFKEAGLSGVLSSISSTLLNIFTTTTKTAGKLIKEMWVSLVSAAKLIFFNPDKLSLGELTKNVLKILAGGLSVVIGSIINVELNAILTIPFGSEISAFLSALVSGILMLGMSYFLEYSELMQKVWNALDNFFKNKYDLALEEFKRLNKKLDEFLLELAQIEFSLNVIELQRFNDSLENTKDEYQRSKLIATELKQRNIETPFEFGNTDSMADWLNSLR